MKMTAPSTKADKAMEKPGGLMFGISFAYNIAQVKSQQLTQPTHPTADIIISCIPKHNNR